MTKIETSSGKVDLDDNFLKSYGWDLFNSSKSARSKIEQRWSEDVDLYESRFSKEESKYSEYLGMPRFFPPKTFTATQRILVDVIETFFHDPEEIVSPVPQKDMTEEKRLAVKSLLNYRLNGHPINIYEEFLASALEATKLGNCIWKVIPELRTKKQLKTYEIPDDEDKPVGIEVEEEVVTAYRPIIQTIPLEDVFFASRATWKDYYKYPIVHRYRRTRDDLSQRGYKNIDEVAAVNQKSDLNPFLKRDSDSGADESIPTIKAAEEIFVYEVWAHLPGKDGHLESGSFIMLGSESGPEVLGRGWLRNELPYQENVFDPNRPPFWLGSAFPESYELYGRSWPSIMKNTQKEITANRNQVREAIARAMRPQSEVVRSGVDLVSLMNHRIGGYVLVDEPGSVREIQTQNPASLIALSQNLVENEFWEASSVPPRLLGGEGQDTTATESTQQLQNAVKRISLLIKNLAYTCYLPAFRALLRLEQVYTSDEELQKITGRSLGWALPNDNTPRRDVIEGDIDLSVNVGINKQAQINKFLLAWDRLTQQNASEAQAAQLGIKQPVFYDTSKLIAHVLSLLGLKNTEEWKIQGAIPQQQGESGQAGAQKGLASQPRNLLNPSDVLSNLSPQESGPINAL